MRELIRQRTLLYQRVGLSTERDTVLALARTGRIDERPRALEQAARVAEDFARALAVNSALEKAWRPQAALARQLAAMHP